MSKMTNESVATVGKEVKTYFTSEDIERASKYIDVNKILEQIKNKECLLLKRDPNGRVVKGKLGQTYTLYNYYVSKKFLNAEIRIGLKPKDIGPNYYVVLEQLFKLLPELPIFREQSTTSDGIVVNKYIVSVYDIINDLTQDVIMSVDSATEKRSLNELFDKLSPTTQKVDETLDIDTLEL